MATDAQPDATPDVICSNCRRVAPATEATASGWGIVREGQAIKVALCDDCITTLLDAE
jgi:hypothetical protein